MSVLLDLIFPKNCLTCGRVGSYICPYCQRLLEAGQVDFYQNKHIEAHLSIFKNTPQIKSPIYYLKYKFVTDIVNDIARLSLIHINRNFPNIVKYWQQFDFCLIPVPLHHQKQNWRAFNQSDLIGKVISKNLDLHYITDLVIKTKLTPTQAQTNTKIHRLKTQNNSFILNPDYKKIPQNIIIFDDIFTTGATTFTISKLFNKNHRIWVLSII